VDSESSEDGVVVLWVFVDFAWRPVASDNYAFGSDEHLAAFGVSFEGVPVRPLLYKVSVDLFRTEFFDYDGLFSLVAIPPDVVGLDEGVGVLGTNSAGFSCSGFSVVILVGEGAINSVWFLGHDRVEVYRFLYLWETFEVDEAFVHCGYDSDL